MTEDREPLTGGVANAGAVFRGRAGGFARRRPTRTPFTPICALRQHGFEAPVPVRITADGRELLTFVPGDVALPPFPAWMMATAALESDGYGLSPGDRAELPGVIEQATEVCRASVARRVAGGDPVSLKALEDRGGWGRWDRIPDWLRADRETFTAAPLE